MNRRERVNGTIEFDGPERVPLHHYFYPEVLPRRSEWVIRGCSRKYIRAVHTFSFTAMDIIPDIIEIGVDVLSEIQLMVNGIAGSWKKIRRESLFPRRHGRAEDTSMRM